MTFKKLLYTAGLFMLNACSDSEKSISVRVPNTYPIKPLVFMDSEEYGWGKDFQIAITSVTKANNVTIYRAESNYDGKTLGLNIHIPNDGRNEKGFGKGFIVENIGEPSNEFIRFISRLYEQKIDTAAEFHTRKDIGYINMQEFAKTLGAKDITEYSPGGHFKLFLQGQTEADYAEWYINIDSVNKWVQIGEKDAEYRPIIVPLLTTPQ